MGETILEMKGITKRFSKVVANSCVDFKLQKGEVHALLGENGAGKTTLMNILYGIYEQDDGAMLLCGKPYRPTSPKTAITSGIGMVHQHFMLVPPMTVLQNIVLGQECNLKRMDITREREEIQKLCDTYKFNLDLDRKVLDLSVGAQQRLELVKALYRGADILILDEPTAVLTPQEVEELFVILRQFVHQGKSIILISHKLWEVKRISDRITVLRNGTLVNTVNNADVEQEDLAAMMVGKKVSFKYEKTQVSSAQPSLVFKDVCAKGNQLSSSLKNLNFSIKKGEILGIAGVDGNGQLELSEVVMGIRRVESGSVEYLGKNITCLPTRERIEHGFAHIPEDRMTQGLVMNFSVSENMVLNCYDQEPFTHKGIFNSKAVKKNGAKLIEEYDVRPRDSEAFARSFSGGNQQKIVIAREFSKKLNVVLAVQPTRGLDIGASQFVHKKLLEGKELGASVLLISADLDEILAVADRVLVINEGQIMGEFIPGKIDYAQIGMMMGGTKKQEQKAGEGA